MGMRSSSSPWHMSTGGTRPGAAELADAVAVAAATAGTTTDSSARKEESANTPASSLDSRGSARPARSDIPPPMENPPRNMRESGTPVDATSASIKVRSEWVVAAMPSTSSFADGCRPFLSNQTFDKPCSPYSEYFLSGAVGQIIFVEGSLNPYAFSALPIPPPVSPDPCKKIMTESGTVSAGITKAFKGADVIAMLKSRLPQSLPTDGS
mmetsp:Transcript_33375/g.88604  ORF Transcript_33375/g.88604 Transcript_33375/m.88604 type:complete len:210 (+) Transcript_33375:463-1092(+)